MRHYRSIRNRGKRQKSSAFELDITSLLDILVILLVFLLQSYNSSGIILNIPSGVELPISESQAMNTPGVMVQVSPSTIWVDDKVIYDQENDGEQWKKDMGNRRIVPLYNALVKKRQDIQRLEKSVSEAAEFSAVVNLIVDKTIRYNDLKSLMFTSAEAGFRKYKFVVLGEE
jgi:biopolymer transport protein ExbD